MAYTRQDWQCGDVITAEKLNHIESGIEACETLRVQLTDDGNGGLVADKTVADIWGSWSSGIDVIAFYTYGSLEYVYLPVSVSDTECTFMRIEEGGGYFDIIKIDAYGVARRTRYYVDFGLFLPIDGSSLPAGTFEAICYAFQQGRSIRGIESTTNKVFMLANRSFLNGSPFIFTRTEISNGNVIVEQVTVASDESTTYSTVTLTP